MAAAYGYSLDREAVSFLLGCNLRERRLLVAAFEQMAQYPTAIGDFSHRGNDGRECHVFAIGEFVVTCWSDHPVKMIRVLLVERV